MTSARRDPHTILSEWTVPAVLRRSVAESPDRIFIETTDGQSATLGEMDDVSRRMAMALRGRGVKPGAMVLIMARNSIAFVQAWFAVNRLGAVLVPINTAFTGDFLLHVARDADAGLVIIDSEFAEAIADIRGELPRLEQVLLLDGLAGSVRGDQGTHGSADDEAITARDIAAVLYTSGTTGRSKGVLLPHGHLHLNAQVYIDNMSVTADDVVYCCLPLFHLNGLTLQVYASLIVGARVVLARQFSASGWLDDIRRHGATITNMLGVMTEFVYAQPEQAIDRDNRLRVVNAVPNPPRLCEAFERRFGTRLVELYGTTEIACPTYMPVSEPGPPGSCGRLVSEFFEARIADPDTDIELAAGEIGEFQVRPKIAWCFMAGYHGLPLETVKSWRNFWFHTGDAMRVEADGYYYYVDRMKDCIRRRGENISSFEVEQAVLACGDVAEIAVVGVSSPFQAGEFEVKAVLVPKPGITIDVPGLVSFCERRIPKYAVPRLIEIVDALPKTATQKIRKDVLRAVGITAATWIDPTLGATRRTGAL